jgi:hypothetical protein
MLTMSSRYLSFFQNITIMLINKRKFDGSTFHYDTEGRLRSCAGSTSCFTTFRPERFPHEDIICRLLHQLHRMAICCFMGGTFVQYTAGILNDYEGAIFVALTEHPLLKTIFQKTLSSLLCRTVQHERI